MGFGQVIGAQGVTIGLLVCAGAIFGHLFVPTMVTNTLREKLVITNPNSAMYESFINASSKVPIYMTYHIFNIVNEDAVMHGAKPQLMEMGPYIYEMVKWKPEANITWHPNATVSYLSRTDYHFRPDLSNGTESDIITTVNIGPYAAVKGLEAHLRKAGMKPSPMLINGFLRELNMFGKMTNTTSILKTLTVKEMLWGYTDPILAAMDPADSFVALQHNATAQVSMKALSAVYTGGKASKTQPQAPEDQPGKMTMWAGMSNLTFWGSPYANMINGTDGSGFAPNRKKGQSEYAFVDTLYRSTLLTNDHTTMYNGVELLRYRIADSTMESETENPDNEAFGLKIKGLMPYPDTVAAPIYCSKPFFLGADTSDVHVDFLNAKPEEEWEEAYDTFLDVEPHTGQLFHVHKRIQVNVHLRELMFHPGSLSSPAVPISFTKGVNSTYLPLMWASENMQLPTHLVDEFKGDVMFPLTLASYGGVILIITGVVLILCGILCVVKCGRKKADDYKDLSHHLQENEY